MSDPTGGAASSPIPPDEDSVTMVDVLREEEHLEEDADAVLGDADDKLCSYSQGYVLRQPLYACLTCSATNRPSAVCLACSYHCHESHELIELYTKRGFRCDCGGARQPDTVCRLTPKAGESADNRYGQNFAGRYCTCGRPYPDPEDTTADQMVQCVVCEDWYHGRHLGAPVPEDGEFTEMTCAGCVTRLPYLRRYASDPEMAANATSESPESEAGNTEEPPLSGCRLKSLSSCEGDGALFWKEGWRLLLCTCDACKTQLYPVGGVQFLLDTDDTVSAYEARGRRGAGSYAQGMRALADLDRIQQVEVVSEYNDLKSELKSYLQKFADNKKVVRKEDIEEFFSGMKSRKRQKTDMSHFCR